MPFDIIGLKREYSEEVIVDKEKEILKRFVETYEDSPFIPQAKARL